MIVYVESPSTLSKSSNTFNVEFTPSLDIANRECWLCVEQFTTSASIIDSAAVVRCNLSQPMSAEFKGQSLSSGNNSVIYIRDIQTPAASPPVLVYIPDGPQNLVFTVENGVTAPTSIIGGTAATISGNTVTVTSTGAMTPIPAAGTPVVITTTAPTNVLNGVVAGTPTATSISVIVSNVPTTLGTYSTFSTSTSTSAFKVGMIISLVAAHE